MAVERLIPLNGRHFPNYSRDEVPRMVDAGHIRPDSYLSKVIDMNGNECWQKLEEPDPDDVPLSAYRIQEQRDILHLLEDNSVVFLHGPSRSGKTEAVLVGSYEFGIPPSNTLNGREDSIFIDMHRYGPNDGNTEVYMSIKRVINKSSTSPKIIMLDEYTSARSEIVGKLIEEGYKVVISSGGNLSNQAKSDNIVPLAEELDIEIPGVELGIKPLSVSQAQEFFEHALESLPNPEDYTTVIEKILDLTATVPLNPSVMLGIFRTLRKDGIHHYQGHSDEELVVRTTDPDEIWELALRKIIQSPYYGEVTQVQEIVKD